MKKAIPLIGLFLMLGGCPGTSVTDNLANTAEPTPTPTPAVAFVGEQTFSCSDRLSRAQWTVCGSAELTRLDRHLAAQWTQAARNASPARLTVQEEDRYTFEAARDGCQDVPCIAQAYRAALGPGYAPPPAPAAAPVARTPPRVRQARNQHRPWRYREPPEWHAGDNRRSCALEVGMPSAEKLAQRCRRNSDGGRSCSILSSCDELRQVKPRRG